MTGFMSAMQKHDITPPAPFIIDGKLHRFHVEGDKPRSTNGWYILFDNPLGGSFGCWKRGVNENWSKRETHTYTDEEKARHKARMEAAKRQREAEQANRHKECRDASTRFWDTSNTAPDNHPYLVNKQVKSHGLRTHKDALAIPVRDTNGVLHGLQFITVTDKKFKPGTNKRGNYFSIGGKPDTVLYLAEGYATAATIHEVTGEPVAVCFDASNLRPVAEALRGKLPDVQIVVCADNDRHGETNVGLTKATEAAVAVNGLLAVPEFPEGMNGTDFNDLAALSGFEEVKMQIVKAVEVEEDWPEPQPLPNELSPVATFDYELLPSTLRPWIEDICDLMQCPPDFVAVAVMTALGSILGRKVGIRPQGQTDWTVTPNMWALAVGRPGVMKSPAIEAALAPLKRLTAKAHENFVEEHEAYQLEQRTTKLRVEASEAAARKELKQNPEADLSAVLAVPEQGEPTLKRYLINDTSPAALGELHRQNHNGFLVHRDEMVSLLRSLDREDQSEGRGFYLTGWNGDSAYTFDRIGRGMNLHIPAVCLSLLGGTQPGRLSGYVNQAVKGGSADDGLIQRFGLTVWPDVTTEWKDIDRIPDSDAKRQAHSVFEAIDKLNPHEIGAHQDTDYDGNPDGMLYLRLDDEARKLFLDWRRGFEGRLRSGDLHPAIESHLTKYRKLVPGLALIIHVTEGGHGPVTVTPMLQALAWSEYLETHAQRVYASATQPRTSIAKAILKHIRSGDLSSQFVSKDVWRPQWSKLTDSGQVLEALKLLVDYDWLIEVHDKDTGGRPKTTYHVNPKVMI